MGRGKRGGALEFVEWLMVVGYGEVLVKGGKVFLGMCLLWWGMVLVFFYREFNDWEGSDKLFWRLNGNGKVDVRSFYNKIRNITLPTFPWKGIWKVKVPRRVAFFMWTAAHG